MAHIERRLNVSSVQNSSCAKDWLKRLWLMKQISIWMISLIKRTSDIGVGNPRILDEKELHPQCVTVWCTMCYRIIGPYFFENAEWRKILRNDQYILKTCCYSSAQSSRAVVSTKWRNLPHSQWNNGCAAWNVG